MRRVLDALDIFFRGRPGHPGADYAFGLVVAVALSPLVVWLVRRLVG